MNRRKVASESISENSGCWESACFLWSSVRFNVLMEAPLDVGLSVASCPCSLYSGRASAPNKVSLQINKPRPHGVLRASVHGFRRTVARGETELKAMTKFAAIVFLIILKFDYLQVERVR
ncbi:hypothetical protein [Pseudomonas oryziphila]|uniref:hypothetical protein n=1 Tax=Pseudomonas oryziphila TaxID=2894079 RepID=UPI001680A5B3|nr:hypothetical protein [Pseudomonas oryziphila]